MWSTQLRPAPAVDPYAEVSDRALVECARSDVDAFAELYRRHVDRVHAFARRRTGCRATADDVTAATFEKALRNLATFRWQGAGFEGWLLRIASNVAADHFRANQRARSPRGVGALRTLTPEPDDSLDRAVERLDIPSADLRAALDRLNPRYQQVIALRYLAGLEPAQAAATVGCSRATFAVVIHRALRALRKALEDLTGDLGEVRA